MPLTEITLEQKVLYGRVSGTRRSRTRVRAIAFQERPVQRQVSCRTSRRKLVGGGVASPWFPSTPGDASGAPVADLYPNARSAHPRFRDSFCSIKEIIAIARKQRAVCHGPNPPAKGGVGSPWPPFPGRAPAGFACSMRGPGSGLQFIS